MVDFISKSRSAANTALGIVNPSEATEGKSATVTILHLLGFDRTKLTFRFQGRDFRLTDVHGNVVTKLLA